MMWKIRDQLKISGDILINQAAVRNIVTTRIYDHRKTRPEDSRTFKVNC